jgi:hypothetical protein
MAMNDHIRYEELLPLYVAGQLGGAQRAEVQSHLAECEECQADLELWAAVSREIGIANRAVTPPPALAEQALMRIQPRRALPSAFLRAWQLIGAQALLVQPEMWPAAAAVMALGIIVSLLWKQAGIIYFVAPLLAASTLTMLYSPEHDPALELSLATPTSPWKILLARLSVVSGYNLLLALVASLGLLLFVPPGLLGTLVLGWFGPLTFLSALALLLSLWLGTSNAIAITYGLWLAQYIPFKALELWMASSAWASVLSAYQQFWHSPLLLVSLSILLIGAALWSANLAVFRLPQSTG